ncbi:MAG TPA: hydantoinase B/oxoprolinase family protein [bacterium]|nr:hydantoinase B/oxoprolinase family protein [bacterium]
MTDLGDPIVLQVLWQRLISVANEQAAALIRTAFTPIVRDAEDLSAAVFDRRGHMIAQSVTGTPGHINSMATGMKHFLAAYPAETLSPGDVLITNDPWQTSGHLHDLTVATPVFLHQTLVGLFANTCHALDIGGRPFSADADDVYEEGLYIPIMKLYERGEPNESLFRILRANVRAPVPVLGDVHAQVACNDVGARSLLALMEEFRLDTLDAVSETIIRRSEEAMRRAIATLPDGEYSSETAADGFDRPIRIKTRVVVAGDTVTVDYTGTSPRNRRGINVPLNYTEAYTTFAIKAAISPEVPNNDGSFRPIRVIAPPDCILNAQPPAPVGARAIVGHFLPGTIFRALGSAARDRAMAAGADSVCLITVHGETSNDPFTYTFFCLGGMGARAGKDGLSATGFPSGVAGTAAEVTETLAPVLIHRRELRDGSGGAGRYRGGLGQTIELAIRTGRTYGVAATADRTRFPAEGVEGGHAGAPARTVLDTGEGLDFKSTHQLAPERRTVLELAGGGGFGEPFARDPRAVLRDVLNGYVRLDEARDHYGVAIRQLASENETVLLPEDFELDEPATSRLRAAARGHGPAPSTLSDGA